MSYLNVFIGVIVLLSIVFECLRTGSVLVGVGALITGIWTGIAFWLTYSAK